MALSSHNSNLKLKLIIGFGFTGFVLLFLLGYNLGSLNQDTKNQTLRTLRKKAHDSTLTRLRSCQRRMRDNKKSSSTENDIKDASDYVEILEKETYATDALSMELKEELDHCMEIRRQVDVKAENLTAIIEHLQQQNTELLEYTESAGLNRTVEQKRNVMRGRIRALRLDNKAMRNRKAQRDIKIKQLKQAHELKETEEKQKAEEREKEEERARDEEKKAREEEELRRERERRVRESAEYEKIDDLERPLRRYDDDERRSTSRRYEDDERRSSSRRYEDDDEPRYRSRRRSRRYDDDGEADEERRPSSRSRSSRRFRLRSDRDDSLRSPRSSLSSRSEDRDPK